MSVYNFFRNIFGFPRRYDEEDPYRSEMHSHPSEEDEQYMWKNQLYDDDDNDEIGPLEEQPFGFKIFTSPLEIHRFFEKQLDDMLKTFQMFESDPMIGIGDFQTLEPPVNDHESKGNDKNLRDELFKPGYRYKWPKSQGCLEAKKEDNDLDESIKGSSLGQILDGEPSPSVGIPDEELQAPGRKITIFGKILTSKTIRRPDGSVEHHKTVKDNQGNEQTTITQQIGNKKYTVITETDSNGVIKRNETFENVNENSIEEFKKRWNIKQNLDENFKSDDIDFRKFF